MTDESEIPDDEEGGDEYVPRGFGLCDGETFVPDVDLLDEALQALGGVPLAYQLRDAQVFVLMACQAGFKWTDIESIGKATERKLRPVQ